MVMNWNELKPYIKQVLSDIATQNHQNAEKKRVKEYEDRMAIACPICGDSQQINSAKRGNLYFKNLRYKCFNCEHSESFISFAKRFDQLLDLDRRMEMVEYIQENMSNVRWSEDEFVLNNLDKLIPINDLCNYFNTSEFSKITNFKPVTKGSLVAQFLENRKITNFDDLYEGTYWHTSNWREPILINMNQAKDKVLGIQIRNIKTDKDKRFYKIVPFSDLYQQVYKKELDEIETMAYNKLSYLYNILKVDWNRPITIFEGFLDTKFFPNAVGCVGTNTDTSFLMNQGVPIRYFYDYDNTGIKKSVEMIKNGQVVFLWEKFFEYWSNKSKEPAKAMYIMKNHFKDLNDVALKIDSPYKKMQLENFFSQDEMDIFYIKNKV